MVEVDRDIDTIGVEPGSERLGVEDEEATVAGRYLTGRKDLDPFRHGGHFSGSTGRGDFRNHGTMGNVRRRGGLLCHAAKLGWRAHASGADNCQPQHREQFLGMGGPYQTGFESATRIWVSRTQARSFLNGV